MKKIFLIASIFLTLTACVSEDDMGQPQALVAAKITATIGESVKTRAGDKTWDKNDEIGITVATHLEVEPYINIKYTTAEGDGKFTGETIYIYNPMDMTAYYPFTGEEGKPAGVVEVNTQAENQTPERQPGIDCLFAGLEGVTVNEKVNFEFTHRMSKLTLKFVDGAGADVSKITSYKIEGLKLKGSFNTATGDCMAGEADAESLKIDLESVKNNTSVPSLILLPQTISNVTLFIYDSANQIYTCSLSFDDNKIEPGNNYLFTITVSKTAMKVVPKITDWESDTSDITATTIHPDDKG